MSSATEVLRSMLDAHGVEWDYGITGATTTRYSVNGIDLTFTPMRDGLACSTILSPEQAIDVTLGREPWVSPTWERWHKSLRHDEIKSIGDAVEQLMYEVIEFGGDMGPNGNTYNGIDEGDVLTAGFINEWVARFESTLGHRTTTRHGKFRTKYGRSVPCCECCGYGIGDERWHYCPSCGAEVVDV